MPDARCAIRVAQRAEHDVHTTSFFMTVPSQILISLLNYLEFVFGLCWDKKKTLLKGSTKGKCITHFVRDVQCPKLDDQ